MSTISSTTASVSVTSTGTTGTTVIPDNIIINPHDPQWEEVDVIVDPSRNDSSAANKSDEDSDGEGDFTYEGFKVTRVLSVPCLFLMLVSSFLLVYIILKHLRAVLYLYISVLFYALTQVLLVLVMVVSWSLSDIPYTRSSCQYLVTLHSVSLVLPAYGLLYITIVRTIFLRRPFDNDLLLKTRYQLSGLFIGLCVCGAVFALPHLGVCGIDLIVPARSKPYCGYRCGSVDCSVFTTIAVIVGYILPILTVLVLYAVIYSTVVVSRQSTRKLTQSGAVSDSEKHDGDTRSKSSNWVDRIRSSMPWCIIIILFLYIISTVPWIPMDLYTPKVIAVLEKRGYSTLLFDILYSVLLLGSGLSSLTYLISSNTLRGLLCIEFKKLKSNVCFESVA